MKLKQFAFLRIISVGLEILFGFIQPFLFSRFFDENAFSFILLLYSYAVYFSFFDVGFGKLSYAKIRSRYVKNESVHDDVKEAIIFYAGLFIIIAIGFSLFAIGFSFIKESPFKNIVLLLFGINMTSNIIFTFLRSVFNAIDASSFFEKFDIIRKFINIFSLTLIAIDDSLLSTQLCTIAGLIVLYFIIFKKMNQTFGIVFKIAWLNIFKQFGRLAGSFKETKFIFLFSLFETLIYNAGYILIPIFLTNRDIIQFNLWMRITLGIAVLMRVITDIFLHPLTRNYFNQQFKIANKILKNTIIGSIGLCILAWISFTILQPYIMKYWVDLSYLFNNVLLISLMLMLTGNSIQHVSGTFLLSLGNQYKWLSKVSGGISIITIVLPGFLWFATGQLHWGVLSFSIIYISGSAIYYSKAKQYLIPD